VSSLLAAVVPLALGAAVSPTLLALQLLVLTGQVHRLVRAWALAAGSALVLAGFMVLCATALARLQPHHAHRSTSGAVVSFVAAALLVGLAVRSRRAKPTPGEQHGTSTAERLRTASTGWFVGAGAVGMVVNFSTLVLVLPAVHEITRSSAGTAAQVVTGVVLFVTTLLPVLVPVLAVSVLGRRADGALEAAHAWLGRNGRRIATVSEVVFAAYLVTRGIAELP
jgi:Sap, sulfolipid-1-addressing protein